MYAMPYYDNNSSQMMDGYQSTTWISGFHASNLFNVLKNSDEHYYCKSYSRFTTDRKSHTKAIDWGVGCGNGRDTAHNQNKPSTLGHTHTGYLVHFKEKSLLLITVWIVEFHMDVNDHRLYNWKYLKNYLHWMQNHWNDAKPSAA